MVYFMIPQVAQHGERVFHYGFRRYRPETHNDLTKIRHGTGEDTLERIKRSRLGMCLSYKMTDYSLRPFIEPQILWPPWIGILFPMDDSWVDGD